MKDIIKEATKIINLNKSLFSIHDNLLNSQRAMYDSLQIPSSIIDQLTSLKSLNSLTQINQFSSWTKDLELLKKQHSVLFDIESSMRKSFQIPKLPISILDSFKSIDTINKHIAKSFSTDLLESLAKLSKPYQGLDKLFNINSVLTENLKALTTHNDLLKHSYLPIIDTSTALAISKIWDKEGVYSQLALLGITDEVRTDETGFADADNKELSPSQLWDRVNLIIALLMFLYQLYDSQMMENRITGKIETSANQTQKQIHGLENLLESVINANQNHKISGVEYVVKNRNTLIRELPKNGAKTIAVIFPNQLVVMLDSEGKWIKIEYFDWFHKQTKTGWVLKKYLMRVSPLF